MIHKLTNRNALKANDWLQVVMQQDWKQVEPPPNEKLKIQQFDFAANLNDGLVIQKIKDSFQSIVQSISDPPSMAERVGSDGQMAVVLHKALHGLTAREASDPDFWAFLSCCGCPKYVRWRWNTDKPDAFWKRIAGNIRKNALSRLWWWADVTCNHALPLSDPLRYTVTKKVHERQTLMMWFVECAFSGHALITNQLAAFQEAHELNDPEQRAICRTVNRLARIVCLDSIETDEKSKVLCQRALDISRLLPA
jgi:hypothetical protein